MVLIIENYLILLPVFIYSIIGICIVISISISRKKYKESTYYKDTKTSFFDMWRSPGTRGEFYLFDNLKHLEAIGAKFIFNIYIPYGNGKMNEIDLIMINEKGIFVFESKNYGGWIFGKENQTNWYQTLPKGRSGTQKNSFYNPIMQNESHIKHLKKIIGDKYPIHSIIVFSDRCTFKKLELDENKAIIIHRSYVCDAIESITARYNAILPNEEIKSIYDKLQPYTDVDDFLKEKHVYDIKNRNSPIFDYETNTYKCPWCNSKLVLRTAKRGNNIGRQFYGCSNYPICKYTKNIDS